VNGFVPAMAGTYAPWHSRISLFGIGGVVFTLPVYLANRMYRRKVYGIETHFGNPRQQPFAVGKGTVLPAFGRGRPGKEFIPGAEICFFPVHIYLENLANTWQPSLGVIQEQFV
jgi:hypothetical protein